MISQSGHLQLENFFHSMALAARSGGKGSIEFRLVGS